METSFVGYLSKVIAGSYVTLLGLWVVLTYLFTVKITALKIAVEVLLCNLSFIVLAPLLVPLLAFNFLIRKIISKFLLGPKFHLIDGIDAVWAPVYPFTVPNFTSLYVIQGKSDLEKIRTRFNALVRDRSEYVRLNYRVTQKLGYYCWEDMSKTFDIRQHVRIFPGCENQGQDQITEDTVFQKIQTIYDDFLSDSRPQWEVLVIPNFKYGKSGNSDSPNKINSSATHYALLFRVHHSILDGVSAGQMLQHGMADYPVKLAVDPLKPLNESKLMKVVPYVLMAVVGARSIVKSLLLKESNIFHGKAMTGPKFLGWSRPLNLKVLTTIKSMTRSSTTAVLVSSFGGSLRQLALNKNLPVPHSIHAAATVAILPYPDNSLQNRFTSAHVPFEIGLKTPAERLRSAFRNMSKVARSPDILLNYHMMQLSGCFPAVIVEAVMANLNSTMLLSNVPGPAENVYMFNGDRLCDAIAFGPFKGKTALGMVLFSYCGRVRAAVVADRVALPDPSRDLDALLRGFEEEIAALGKTCGISTSCFMD